MLALDVWCAGIRVWSSYDRAASIHKHIGYLLAPTSFPVPTCIETCSIRNASCCTTHARVPLEVDCSWTLDDAHSLTRDFTRLVCTQGAIRYNAQALMMITSGELLYDATNTCMSLSAWVRPVRMATYMADTKHDIYLTARVSPGSSEWRATNPSETIAITSSHDIHGVRGMVRLPLAYIMACVPGGDPHRTRGIVEAMYDFESDHGTCSVSCTDMGYGTQVVPEQLSMSCEYKTHIEDEPHTHITAIATHGTHMMQGIVDIQKDCATWHAILSCSEQASDTVLTCKGSRTVDRGESYIQGQWRGVPVEGEYTRSDLQVHASLCYDGLRCTSDYQKCGSLHATIVHDERMMVDVTYLPAYVIEGTVDVSCLTSLPWVNGLVRTAYGVLTVRAEHTAQGIRFAYDMPKGMCAFAAVPLPIYGMSGYGEYDIDRSHVTFPYTCIKAGQGTIHITQARLWWESVHGSWCMHIPVRCDHVGIAYARDVYAVLVGSVIVQYSSRVGGSMHGRLFIEQGRVTPQILSPAWHKRMWSRQRIGYEHVDLPWYYDIAIRTRNPVSLSTPFIDLVAHIHTTIAGYASSLHYDGAIRALEGAAHFPAATLHLTDGLLTFSDVQPIALNIRAEGAVNGRHVTLAHYGVLGSSDIQLYSSPALSREALAALLVGGAEAGVRLALTGSFKTLLYDMILGDQNTLARRWGSAIPQWFSSIRVSPAVEEAHGRRGIRGSVTIDVSERLSGRVQKNLTYPEEAQYDVLYRISDDALVRGYRDEFGQLGLEGQLAWGW